MLHRQIDGETGLGGRIRRNREAGGAAFDHARSRRGNADIGQVVVVVHVHGHAAGAAGIVRHGVGDGDGLIVAVVVIDRGDGHLLAVAEIARVEGERAGHGHRADIGRDWRDGGGAGRIGVEPHVVGLRAAAFFDIQRGGFDIDAVAQIHRDRQGVCGIALAEACRRCLLRVIRMRVDHVGAYMAGSAAAARCAD